MKEYIVILFIVIFLRLINCSVWNEIPQRCIYDRTKLFSCWNTTFTQPIPLLNNLTYTLQNHHVQIRDTYFQLSLNDLFIYVGPNIKHLTLVNNTFSSNSSNQTMKIYFRLLQTLEIYDAQGLQWLQLNSSYFPQLINLDLSYNQFSNQKKLVFNQANFPMLKSLNFSHNQLQTIDNLTGNIFNRIEMLILSFNPLETIINEIQRFPSLVFLDLSSTLIKQLFSITLFPRLETFHCRHCQQIPINEYQQFLSNCSHNLIIDFSETNINSFKSLNPYLKCFKDLTLSDQPLIDSISTEDFLSSANLENIQLRMIEKMNSIQLNIYDRLKSIDFSNNKDLKQVKLRLMSDYTYLQRLTISHSMVNDLSIDFNHTTQKFLQIDAIDLSYNRLESLDFLQYLTFISLDVSFNRLKIVHIEHIHFRHGMYELLSMNVFNLSSNEMESIKINWENESPHTIDLSENNLQSIELHGQTTYSLLLNNNPKLSPTPTMFSVDFPFLQYLNLNSIQLNSLENLIYLHNLSKIQTLLLNNNHLLKQHRILNWNVFYPWRQTLTHVSLRNMSLEAIDTGVYLNDYPHLLTIDFYENNLECNCILHPFIDWLKTLPPPLADFYEPLNKVLSFDCPVSIFDLRCDDGKMKSTLFLIIFIVGVSMIILLTAVKVLHCYIKRKRSKPYDRMLVIDSDVIALNETILIQTTDDDG